MVGVDESQGESKAAKSNTQSVLQAYQQYKQQIQQSTPQASAYSNIKGYDPTQPANSAYNRTILSYNSAGVPYDILSTGGGPTDKSQPASVFAPSTKPDPALAKAASIGFQSVEVYDKSGGVIATLPIGSANDKLNSLANQYGEISYKPVNQKSVNPEMESLILQSFTNNPQELGKVITSQGSYLNSLVAKGVLTSEDIDKINAISGSYNTKIQKENAATRQQNIQASFKEQADIRSNLEAAQKAGVSSVNIVNAKGDVIGTVNPQNLGQARLQTLKLIERSGGVGLQYNTATTTSSPGFTASSTTYQPSNVLTAFTGGAVGGFAELGLIGIGLLAKLTGKEITIPGTGYTAKPTGILQQAQEKVSKTFGQETLDKIISGKPVDFTNPNDLASLAGFGAAIIATGGVGGARTIIQKGGMALLDVLREGTPAYQKAVLFERQASRLPPPASIKPIETPTVPTFSTTEINLGKGVGRSTGGGGSTSLLNTRQTSPGTPPSGGTEIRVGKGGLTQLVREKPVLEKPKVITKLKQEDIRLGKGEGKLIQTIKTEKQKPAQKTLAQLKNEQYIQQIQNLKNKQRFRIDEKTGQMITIIPKQEQVQKQSTGLITKTSQKQKQELRKDSMTGLLQRTSTFKTGKQLRNKTTITGQVTTPIQRQQQEEGGTNPILNTPDVPSSKRFGGILPGGGITPGALGKVSKGGSRKIYTGNVPFENIVGVYNRSEISYGTKAAKLTKQAKTSSQNFDKLSSKGSKKFRF